METEREEGGGGDTNTSSRLLPPPPVLLVDGLDVEDEEGLMDLAGRMEDLSTSGEGHLGGGESSEHYSASSDNFDRIIGAIEEIVVGEEFQALQNFFLSTYWTKFSEKEPDADGSSREEEEKHEHFKIFQTYSQEMAHLLESQLKKAFRDEHFDFNEFVENFAERAESTEDRESNPYFESEIFEMLFTLTDFVKFKELFTDYKEMMEGKTPNLATGIHLKSIPTPRN